MAQAKYRTVCMSNYAHTAGCKTKPPALVEAGEGWISRHNFAKDARLYIFIELQHNMSTC